jgi:hypothetical protein
MTHSKTHPYYLKVAEVLRNLGLQPDKEDDLIQDILRALFLSPLDIRASETGSFTDESEPLY